MPTDPTTRTGARRGALPFVIVLVAAAGLLAACTSERTGTGDAVARSAGASSGTAEPLGAQQDVASGDIASVVVPPCPEYSDEHICMFVKNEAVGFDANGAGANLPLSMENVDVRSGRYHWGPHKNSWQDTKNENLTLWTGTTWRMEVNDDGNNYADAAFTLKQDLLGEVFGWAHNNGGRKDPDSYGGCRGTDHLACHGWLAEGSQDPDEEAASYAYLIRNAPLTLKVENSVPGSQLTVTDAVVLGGPKEFAATTTLKKDAVITTNGEARWNGFRSFADDSVNTINVQLRITATSGAPGWNNSLVNVKIRTDRNGLVKDASACTVQESQSSGVVVKCSGPDATVSANAYTPIVVTVRVRL